MDRNTRGFAAVLAVMGWWSLLTQLWLTTTHEMAAGNGFAWGLVVYFGYFTLLTNGYCALVATSFALGNRLSSGWDRWRRPWVVTGAMAAIVVVGSVYYLLLRHQFHPQGLNWVVDRCFHYVMPVAFVAFWWRTVPRGALQWSHLPPMMAYPSAYLGYLMVRGEAIGQYPYFFVDVARLGYPQVLLNATGIAVAFLLLLAAAIRLRR
ncbi:MAG: Pr6Pr family membrane protein [Gammaproteobacteria bacterium]